MEVWTAASTTVLPTSDDLHGTALALARLQRVYRIPINSIMTGYIAGVFSSVSKCVQYACVCMCARACVYTTSTTATVTTNATISTTTTTTTTRTIAGRLPAGGQCKPQPRRIQLRLRLVWILSPAGEGRPHLAETDQEEHQTCQGRGTELSTFNYYILFGRNKFSLPTLLIRRRSCINNYEWHRKYLAVYYEVCVVMCSMPALLPSTPFPSTFFPLWSSHYLHTLYG